MKKYFLVLSMAILAVAACNKKDLLPVAYINEVEGYSFSPAEVPASGAQVEIKFTTNYTWKISGYTSLSWCSVDKIKGEAGEGTVIVNVEPNGADEVRSASFDILAGAAIQTVTISQTERNTVSVGTSSYPSVSAEGELIELQVSANVDYTVDIPEDINWISVISTKVVGTSSVMLQVSPSSEWMPRSAEISVVGGGYTVPVSITQNGAYTQAWSKAFSSDWSGIPAGTVSPVAMYGDRLLISNGNEIHAVSPSTGDYLEETEIQGLAVSPQSLASDDAGNILIAANTACPGGGYFTVYSYNGGSLSELVSYDSVNMWGGTIGNVRVVGDIKSKAVVCAVVSTANYYVAWQIEGGAVSGNAVTGAIAGSGINDVIYGCVSPVSDDLDDGLLFIGYSGSPYSLYHSTVTSADWKAIYDTGTAGNENYNSISVVEFGGKKYCAIGQDGHFSWSVAPKAIVLDITDLADVSPAFEVSFQDAATFGSVGKNDVKLVAEKDALCLYLVNAGFDYAAKIILPEK